jgi:hypothetical protein
MLSQANPMTFEPVQDQVWSIEFNLSYDSDDQGASSYLPVVPS